MITTFDFALSYLWEYDESFVHLAERTLQQQGLTTFIITENNIADVTESVKKKKLWFRTYLDRASDVDEDFSELAEILTKRKCRIFNPYSNVEHAIDKANMHLEFITAGLNVPYSIIIPPHNQKKEIKISVNDLAILGRPFIIKPCNTTGGGIGVVKGAESLKDVLTERVENKSDKYLIQQKIVPGILGEHRAWFRCFWAFGKPVCTWWDDETHIYNIISSEQLKLYSLHKLFQITRTIAAITGLDFFSTEIVLTPEKKFVVIDYVNDQCDMRFKKFHTDGVPEEIIEVIINRLKIAVKKVKRSG